MFPRFLTALLLTAAILPVANVSAQSVYVVHGIPGDDLGLPRELPVDVCLKDGTEVTADFKFGEIRGPLSLPPAAYELDIRLASQPSCQGTVVIPVSFLLSYGENAAVVAHLTEQGTIAATKFVNDANALAPGKSRIVVRHGAAAPPVNILVRRGQGSTFLKYLRNADQSVAKEVSDGVRKVTVYSAESGRKIAGPIDLNLEAGKATFVYAVGSLRNGTFTVVPQVIPLP